MEPRELNDEELYEQWFGLDSLGERLAAAGEIERRYRRRLSVSCRRILQDVHLAEDAIAFAFLKLYEKRRTFTSTLPAWLWATARNRSLYLLKYRSPHDPLPVDLPGDGPDPSEDCISIEQCAALEACLSKLAPEDRAFVELCACDGLTYDEAAEVVGWELSPAGYNYRFNKTLERLRDCLEKARISY